MPRILVTKPFEARFQHGKPRRQFPVGEHLLTQEELDYWFVKTKIKAGTVQVLPDLGEDPTPGQANQVDQLSQVQQASAIEDEFLSAMNCSLDAASPAAAPALDAKPVKAQAPAAKPKAPAAKPKAKPAAKPKGKGK